MAIRVTRPYASAEEFLEHELETLTRTSVTLIGAQPRPKGVILRFEVAMPSGGQLLRGEGRVVGFKENALGDQPGLVLRFTRLDTKSKALVDRAAAIREGRARAALQAAMGEDSMAPAAPSLPPGSIPPGSIAPMSMVQSPPPPMVTSSPSHASPLHEPSGRRGESLAAYERPSAPGLPSSSRPMPPSSVGAMPSSSSPHPFDESTFASDSAPVPPPPSSDTRVEVAAPSRAPAPISSGNLPPSSAGTVAPATRPAAVDPIAPVQTRSNHAPAQTAARSPVGPGPDRPANREELLERLRLRGKELSESRASALVARARG